MADIKPARFGAAAHEKEEVIPVGKELRESMKPLLRRLELGYGSAPSAEVRRRDLLGLGEKMMTPLLFHAPPIGTVKPAANVLVDPVSRSSRFSFASAKNPMDLLSGDQNGNLAP